MKHLYIILLLMTAGIMSVRAGEHRETIVFLGDSNTWLGGDDCKDMRGWTYWFGEKYSPVSMRSYARSGATWTNTINTRIDSHSYTEILDDNNVIFNQAIRLIEAADIGAQKDPDIIFICAGTNDAWFSPRRPGIFDQTIEEVYSQDTTSFKTQPISRHSSLAASIRITIQTLSERFPNTMTILIIPSQATVCSYESQEQVADIIAGCAARESIPVIDLMRNGGTSAVHEAIERRNTYDGVHTTERGAKKHGTYIARQLQNIIQNDL